MGDIPIYVAHDSADVWAHPELFYLDDQGNPTVVSGVPPDYFSATGQLWGNPIYRWDVLEADGYKWWIERFRASLALFDLVRLDHFRGFEVLLGGSGRENDSHARAMGQGAGRRTSVGAAERIWRTADRGRKPGSHHAAGRGTAKEVRPSGHEHPAVCVRDGPAGTILSSRTITAATWSPSPAATTTTRRSAGGRVRALPTAPALRRMFARSTTSRAPISTSHDDAEINWIMIRAVQASVADVAIVPVAGCAGTGQCSAHESSRHG